MGPSDASARGSGSSRRCATGADYLKLNRQRVGEIADETVDLSDEDIEDAKKEWEEERKRDPEKGKTIPGSLYRRYRQRPLLTIHLIEPRDPKDDSKHKDRMMPAAEIEAGVLSLLAFPSRNSRMETRPHAFPIASTRWHCAAWD